MKQQPIGNICFLFCLFLFTWKRCCPSSFCGSHPAAPPLAQNTSPLSTQSICCNYCCNGTATEPFGREQPEATGRDAIKGVVKEELGWLELQDWFYSQFTDVISLWKKMAKDLRQEEASGSAGGKFTQGHMLISRPSSFSSCLRDWI